MTSIAKPLIRDMVRVRPRRTRHRTTEITIHKSAPGGAKTADEVAQFYLSRPEGVATTTISGSWSAKLPVFYSWARMTWCPTCGAKAGAFCSVGPHRRPVPHPERAGVIPDAHLQRADVPYHFMVEQGGLISQHLPLNARGTHARRANARAVAVACVGDFEHEEPSDELLRALRWLVKWLALDDKVRAATHQDQGTLAVRGHDQVRDQPKGCPGRLLLPHVADIDNWLSALVTQLQQDRR